ncbi:MAG: insulinase family protein [Deltaproteobacteria bacterium]|nr:MAG: insulinase family protein [Deltaproteobacteria bacterium]
MLTLLSLAALAADPLATTASVHTLDNGLTVVIEEDRRSDTVALHLHYGVGARDELPGELGCAHLFEHLMFEGSANVPTNAFDTWLTEAGGWNNAFTSEDQTAYHMAFPSGALDLALFLESDRMGFLDAGLDQDNLDNQIKVVLQERAEGYARPNGRDFDALSRLGYSPEHPYHHPVIGTVADVEGFKIDAVKSFWSRWYRPENATLVLVGNFDEAEALAKVEHWFSDVPARGEAERAWLDNGTPGKGEAESYPMVVANGVIEDDVQDRSLYVAWPVPNLNHADMPALEVLSWVMSGGRGTRVEDALYYDKPLTTDATAFAWFYDVDGRFMIAASTAKPKLAKIEKVIDKTVAQLSSNPPTEAEIDRAKRSIRAYLESMMESPEDRAEQIAECMRHTGKPQCVPELWTQIDAVTSADLVRVAETYLVDDTRITLSVVPPGDGGALEGAVPVELP